AQLVRAFIRELDEAHIFFAQRTRGRMPAGPRFGELVVVATARDHVGELFLILAGFGTFRAVLGSAVHAFHLRSDRSELRALRGILRRRSGNAELQQHQRTGSRRAQLLLLVLLRGLDRVAEVLEPALGRLRVEKLRVHIDERGVGPAGRSLLAAEVGQLAIHALDELIGGFLGRCRGLRRVAAAAAGNCDGSRNCGREPCGILHFTPTIIFLMKGVRTSSTTPPITPHQNKYRNWPGIDGRLFGSKSPENLPARLLPIAVARNHRPITWPTKRAGASLVIELKPTGLRHSSPKVWNRYVSISQVGNTFSPATT